jgi:3-oxoacyl-[acyl-carrier protein] reductase
MDKVYLILGASSDLGCALIENLLEKEDSDYRIIAHYHSVKDKLEELSGRSGGRMDIVKADLSSLDSTQKMIDGIQEKGIFPTHIINFSAVAYRLNRLKEVDIQRLNTDMTIQVYSFALICKAFIPHMSVEKYGKIAVMLSAVTTGVPPKNTTEYTTVKYALLGLIKSMAADYGEYGININAVSPGMIETKFIRNVGRKTKEFTAERNPQHRNLKVDDVIPALLFLLSDNSSFMNGTNINLSGIPD